MVRLVRLMVRLVRLMVASYGASLIMRLVCEAISQLYPYHELARLHVS